MTDISKETLKDIIAQVDKWDLAFLNNMGKSTAELDENGVVYIKDEAGNTRIMMCEKDYQDMLEYGKENNPEKRTCREKETC
jgi:hypothetical protein